MQKCVYTQILIKCSKGLFSVLRTNRNLLLSLFSIKKVIVILKNNLYGDARPHEEYDGYVFIDHLFSYLEKQDAWNDHDYEVEGGLSEPVGASCQIDFCHIINQVNYIN